jgi:hypothetical protein
MQTVAEARETEQEWRILRFEVAGKWTARDWETLMGAVAGLYELMENPVGSPISDQELVQIGISISDLEYISDKLPTITNDEIRFIARQLRTKTFRSRSTGLSVELALIKAARQKIPRLQVRRIDYASPGLSDFLGAGEILKRISKVINDYLPWISSSGRHAEAMRKKERELKDIEIEERKYKLKLIEEQLNQKKIQTIMQELDLSHRLDTERAVFHLNQIRSLFGRHKIATVTSFPEGQEPEGGIAELEEQ